LIDSQVGSSYSTVCARTALGQQTTQLAGGTPTNYQDPSWLAVDLGGEHIVRAVRLTGPVEAGSTANWGFVVDLTVRVGRMTPPLRSDPVCAAGVSLRHQATDTTATVVNCALALGGRVVSIWKPGQLALCEVEVFGDSLEVYDVHPGRTCVSDADHAGTNGFYTLAASKRQDCEMACTREPLCVSFIWDVGTTTCSLSMFCTAMRAVRVESTPYDLFVKRSVSTITGPYSWTSTSATCGYENSCGTALLEIAFSDMYRDDGSVVVEQGSAQPAYHFGGADEGGVRPCKQLCEAHAECDGFEVDLSALTCSFISHDESHGSYPCGSASATRMCFEVARTEHVRRAGLTNWARYAPRPKDGVPTLLDVSGQGQDITFTGAAAMGPPAPGYGAAGAVGALEGGAADDVNFGPRNSVHDTFTICSLTRYRTDSNQHMVLRSSNSDIRHGHASGHAGVANYVSTWRTPEETVLADKKDWLIMCGTSGDPDNIVRAAGQDVRLNAGPASAVSPSPAYGSTLHINGDGNPTYRSDFAVAEVIVWQAQLTLAEIQAVEAHLFRVLANGNGLRHGGYMKAAVGTCDDPRAPIDAYDYAALVGTANPSPQPLRFGAVVSPVYGRWCLDAVGSHADGWRPDLAFAPCSDAVEQQDERDEEFLVADQRFYFAGAAWRDFGSRAQVDGFFCAPVSLLRADTRSCDQRCDVLQLLRLDEGRHAVVSGRGH
jgi:hypothetical protein